MDSVNSSEFYSLYNDAFITPEEIKNLKPPENDLELPLPSTSEETKEVYEEYRTLLETVEEPRAKQMIYMNLKILEDHLSSSFGETINDPVPIPAEIQEIVSKTGPSTLINVEVLLTSGKFEDMNNQFNESLERIKESMDRPINDTSTTSTSSDASTIGVASTSIEEKSQAPSPESEFTALEQGTEERRIKKRSPARQSFEEQLFLRKLSNEKI
jgi:hypothetical protein